MTDYLQVLPTDDHPITPTELDLLKPFLKNEQTFFSLLNDFKEPIAGGILFMILSSYTINTIIENISGQSGLTLLFLKTILFIILLFIYQSKEKSLFH